LEVKANEEEWGHEKSGAGGMMVTHTSSINLWAGITSLKLSQNGDAEV
jgi:hypothetical protein